MVVDHRVVLGRHQLSGRDAAGEAVVDDVAGGVAHFDGRLDVSILTFVQPEMMRTLVF